MSSLRGWIVPIVIALFASGGGGIPPWLVIAALAGILSTFLSVVHYLVFHYGYDGERLLVREGLFFRQARDIPIGRVQNIHLRRGVVHRILGVAQVRIDTAVAGKKPEVHLSVVGLRDARVFRDALLADRNRVAATATEIEPDVAEVIRRSSLGELLLAGMTENRIGVIAGALWGLFELSEDLGGTVRVPLAAAMDRILGGGTIVAIGVAITVFIVMGIVGWLLSIAITCGTYYGFTLRRRGDELRLVHGLFTRFEMMIPLRRLQVLRIESNPIRRFLGWRRVQADTAGAAAEKEGGRTAILCPLIREIDVASFCDKIIEGGAAATRPLTPVHPRARGRGFVRLLLLGTGICAVVAITAGTMFWLVIAPWIAVAYLLAGIRYRALGYDLNSRHLTARGGIWTRRRWVVPVEKIQSVAVIQSPIQRILGLATLTVATAVTGPFRQVKVIDLAAADAQRLFDDLAFQSARSTALADGV